MLVIRNNGEDIAETNFFDSEMACAGYFYLSWNAGAARLLVPDNQQSIFSEISGTRFAIVSFGPLHDAQNREMFEIIFEDQSDSPFVLHLSSEQSDRRLPETDQGGGISMAFWTRAGKHSTIPCKFRRVDQIPHLEPWIEH